MLNSQLDTEGFSQTKGIQFKYFFLLLTLFIATWLSANIAAIKLIAVYGITLTGGFFIFPITTMIGSIIVEVYGYKNARQATWAGFIINLTFIFFINAVNLLPSSPYWHLNNEFQAILLPDTRIVCASLASFFISDFMNSYLMAKMKISSHGRSLLKRIFIASSISLFLDTLFFIMLGFYGKMPTHVLINLILLAYAKKMICQVGFFPLISYFIRFFKRAEGLEIYDYGTKYNPFSLDNIYDLKVARRHV